MLIGQTIYLDHQATTPVDSSILSAMTPYFGDSFGNPHSTDHSIGWQAAQAVEKAANGVASLIGADSDEIVFTSGATEANNLALLGLGARTSGGKRQRILVSAIEHRSVLAVARVLQERLGYRIESLPVDAGGFVDVEKLQDTLSEDVLVVSVMTVNNEIGTIQNIHSISEIVRNSGAFFHCDAAQAPCAIDLTNFSQCVDLLSLSGHKMYGPQGIGALFIRRDLQDCIEPLVHGGGQQRNLRSGTLPVPLCVGIGAAAERFQSRASKRERALLSRRRDLFVTKLMGLQYDVSLNGPASAHRHPGNANIRFNGFNAHDVLNSLQPRLAASTGSACTSGIPELSHVLKAIGLSDDEAASSIRFSLGQDTTDRCIDEAVTLIHEGLTKLTDNDLTLHSERNILS